jgi:hypothetical protein
VPKSTGSGLAYICIHTYIHTYTHTHISIHIHAFKYKNACICTYICINSGEDEITAEVEEEVDTETHQRKPLLHVEDLFDALRDKPWGLRCTKEFADKLIRLQQDELDATFKILSKLASGEHVSSIMKLLQGTQG